MTRWHHLLGASILLGAASCSPRFDVGVVGDCAGTLVTGGQPCEPTGCPGLHGDALVVAVGDEGCAFVEWTGECGTERTCQANRAGAARFERTAWPLTLDALGAGDLEVRVEPLDAGCDALCELWLPAGSRGSVVTASPLGSRAAFSGDCDEISAQRCSFLVDRPRSIVVARGSRLVTVRTHGPGRLTVESAGIHCGPDSTCTGWAPAQGLVEALATPANPATDLIEWASPSTCAGPSCTAADELTFEVTFIPRAVLSVTSIGDGFGGAKLDGATIQLPYQALFRLGTELALTAVPAPDDVMTEFVGVPCEVPRRIDECRFTLTADTAVQLRFTHFFEWIAGGWSNTQLQPLDLLPTDGGVLLAAYYQVASSWLPPSAVNGGSAVIELDLDAGVRRWSASEGHGLVPVRFLRAPDGGVWLGGPLTNRPGASPRSSVEWGDVDASVPDRDGQDFGLLDFDLARFTPVRFRAVPARLVDSDVTVASSLIGTLGEQALLPIVESAGRTDGGTWSPATTWLGYWTHDLVLQSALAIPVAGGNVSLADTRGGPAMLFQSDTNSAGATCTASEHAKAYLARISSSMACVAPTPIRVRPLHDGGVEGVGSLEPFEGGAAFQTTLSERGRLVTADVHAVDENLVPRWQSALRPIAAIPGSFSFMPVRLLTAGGWLFSVWSYSGSTVEGFESSEGLTIPCATGTASTPHLLIVRHAGSTGRIDWGLCLRGDHDGVERFSGLTSATLVDGRLLVAAAAAAPAAGRQLSFGTKRLSLLPSVTYYLLAVTPPLE